MDFDTEIEKDTPAYYMQNKQKWPLCGKSKFEVTYKQMRQRRDNGQCFYIYPSTINTSIWSNMRFVNYKPAIPKYILFNQGTKSDPTIKPISKEEDDPKYQKMTESNHANLNIGTREFERMILDGFKGFDTIKLRDDTNFDLTKEFPNIWDHIDPRDTKVTVERKLIITISKDAEPEENSFELFIIKLKQFFYCCYYK